MASDWKVTLAAREWVSPSFELPFEITASGIGDRVVVASVEQASDGGSFGCQEVELIDGRPRAVSFRWWQKDRVLVRLAELSPKAITVIVRRTKTPLGSRTEAVSPNGEIYLFNEYDSSGGVIISGGTGLNHAIYSPQGFLNRPFERAGAGKESESVDWEHLPHGTRLIATLYRKVQERTVAFNQYLPDPALHPGIQ